MNNDYRQATKVSSKHFKAPTQFKLSVKNDSVATYGFGEVVSGFGAKTRQVQQQSSTASHRNTELSPVVPFKVYGIVHKMLLGQV